MHITLSEGEKIEIGEEAERFLKNPAVRAAFEEMDRALYHRWCETQTAAEREDVWKLRTHLRDFQHVLGLFVQTGKLARGPRKLA